jgi:hypothetical protein
MTGKLTYSAKLATGGHDVDEYHVTSRRLSGKGMYLVTVTSGDKIVNTKLVID